MTPPPIDDAQRRDTALEEIRHLVEQRRFVMKSYMQALALYLALAGFALRELLTAPSSLVIWVLAGLFTCLNVLAFYAAGQFKSMALHAAEREAVLAKQLGMQEPHSLVWGYKSGITVVLLYQASVIATAALKLRRG